MLDKNTKDEINRESYGLREYKQKKECVQKMKKFMLNGEQKDEGSIKHCPNSLVRTIKNIEKELIELKKNEPSSDNEFFRLAIMDYELGDLARSLVYSNRFNESNKVQYGSNWISPEVILSNGKLAMADLVTQLHMLCLSLGWNFEDLRELGLEHLRERQKDFERDGWSEVK